MLTKAGEQNKIKEVIDLKNRLDNALAKCNDLKVDSQVTKAEGMKCYFIKII